MVCSKWLSAALGSCLVTGVVAGANAQRYPAKPIRIIAPYAAGGSSDTIARIIALKLNEAWSQPVVVDNRGGVGGSLGTELVAKSSPDGYSLLVGNIQPVAINQNIYRKLGYDTLRDLTRRSPCSVHRRRSWWCIRRYPRKTSRSWLRSRAGARVMRGLTSAPAAPARSRSWRRNCSRA